MSYVLPANGQTILASHITQFGNVLTGVTGELTSLTGYSSAVNYSLSVRNQGSGGLAQRWLNSSGVVIGAIADAGATLKVPFGSGTYLATSTYLNTVGGAGSVSNTGVQAIGGASGSAVAWHDAVAIVQKWAAVNSSGGANPALYVSIAKQISSTPNASSSYHATAIIAEAMDALGGTNDYIEAIRGQATLNHGAVTASGYGAVFSAVTDDATITPKYLVAVEAGTIFSSGDAPTVMLSTGFVAPYIAANGFGAALSIADAAFTISPTTPAAFQVGFNVPTSAVIGAIAKQAAFRAYSKSIYGLDLQGGAFTGAGVTLPNGSAIAWLNAAGSLLKVGIKINSADHVEVGQAGFPVEVPAGVLYVGDTSNAFGTAGATINQTGADDEILTLKSSDVAHALTGVTEADSYLTVQKAAATTGGGLIRGFQATGVAHSGLVLQGVLTDAGDTTKSTAGHGAVIIRANKNSAGALAVIGGTGNLCSIEDNGTTRFIFQADGTSYEDVGTAWTNYDEHDDLAVLSSLSHELARPGNPIDAGFGEFLALSRPMLEALDIVAFNDGPGECGRPFVNTSRLQMLLVGAVRQIGARMAAVEAQIQAALPAA